jgi:geranylgeranyl diphosphate synthase type II
MPYSVADYRGLIESGLEDLLPCGRVRAASRLNSAIRFAVFPGGKRMRPMLALMGAQIVNSRMDRAIPAACATEFLHAASLIFDDLPAMDDADVRRGRPTLHLAYGEDIALLTALALLNQAYAIFGRTPALIREATECIGTDGMIGGQAVDLDIRTAGGTPEKFDSRNRKTTALMRLTLTAGALACGANKDHVEALARCGECLGEAYQIYDDILDQFGRCEETGKTANQDARHHRPSHVLEFGSDASLDHVSSLIAESKETLHSCFGKTEAVLVLTQAIDSIVCHVRVAGLVTA